MEKRPILFWVAIAVVVFVCVFVGIYMTLRVFVGNPNSQPPTAMSSLTTVPPTNTPLPGATRVVATVIPGLTNTATVAPSATSVLPKPSATATAVQPTAKSSPTSSPTVKPSSTAVPPTVVPSATKVSPTPTLNPVQNIIWRWLTVTQLPTDSETTVAGAYTITFYADGSLSGVADCNTFGGNYSQAHGFTIEITAATSTFCGESSLDTEYIQLLNEVVSGGPDGLGNLALETAGGAERMVFANGGAVVKP
jgi:heat shock protein HslJ